jgi:hypothetical protein
MFNNPKYNLITLQYDFSQGLYWVENAWSNDDAVLAKQLCIPFKDYSRTLIQEYNAIYAIRTGEDDNELRRGLFFETAEDATKAFIYIQSIVVANKLAEK